MLQVLSLDFREYVVLVLTDLPQQMHINATSEHASPEQAFLWFEEELEELLLGWMAQRVAIDSQKQHGQQQQPDQGWGGAAGAGLGPHTATGAACTANGHLAADFFDFLMANQVSCSDWWDDFDGQAGEERLARAVALALTWVACEATLLPNLSRGSASEQKCFATAASLCNGSLSEFFPFLDLLLREGEQDKSLPTSCVVLTPRGLKEYLEVRF